MLGEVTTVYVFLIELGSLLLYCYRVFGVRRRIPSALLMGIACFAVYYMYYIIIIYITYIRMENID